MPGNGKIGGGRSCEVLFEVKNNRNEVVSKGQAIDRDVGGNFTIMFTFPDGTTKQVPIRGNDAVTFKWD